MEITDKSLGLSHPFLLLDGKHLLSVTCAIYEEGLWVQMFQLVQQPSATVKYSYDSNPEAFALIKKENFKKSIEVPLAPQSPQVVNRFITEAMPLSFRFPGNDEVEIARVHKWNVRNTIEDITALKPVELDKLTKFDRQRGWYIEVKDRPSKTQKDTFYRHLLSNLKVRSMIELYYFIETGKRPTQGDTSAITAEINKKIDEGSNKRIRGKKLVEIREVGLYDEEKKMTYRRPILATKSQPTTSKCAKKENKKRKREEGVSPQEARDRQDENSRTIRQNIYTLYDCQTLV